MVTILIAERLVDKTDERRHIAEHAENAAVEAGFGRKPGGKLATGEELPVLPVLGGFVLLRETPRHALQPFPLQAAVQRALERRRFDDRPEAAQVVRDLFAHGLQLWRFRRVHPAADPDAVGRYVKVHAGADALRELAVPEARG